MEKIIKAIKSCEYYCEGFNELYDLSKAYIANGRQIERDPYFIVYWKETKKIEPIPFMYFFTDHKDLLNELNNKLKNKDFISI